MSEINFKEHCLKQATVSKRIEKTRAKLLKLLESDGWILDEKYMKESIADDPIWHKDLISWRLDILDVDFWLQYRVGEEKTFNIELSSSVTDYGDVRTIAFSGNTEHAFRLIRKEIEEVLNIPAFKEKEDE